MSLIIISVFVLVFVLWFYKRSQKPKEFPPGPPRWPIIGSLPYITGKEGNLLLGLFKPVQKFGPVLGYYVGNTPVILVTDYNILKEICKLDSLSHRPSISPIHYFTDGWETMLEHGDENIGRPPGIVFSNGNYWKEQRRFVARNLKDFGFGKSTLETLVEEEVFKLCKFLKSELKDGAVSVSVMQPLKLVIISILWTILFGEQLGINNPKLAELIHLIDEGLRVISPQTFLGLILPDPRMTLWPVLRNLTGMNMVKKIRGPTNEFLTEVIKTHQQTMDESNLRGFVDRQLLEIQKTTDSKSSFFGSSGFYAMFNNVSDIFLAGQDTTSSSILWTFLYLLHHPEFQTQIHKELDEVIGKGRQPQIKDKENLHFLNAVLQESHRAIGHVPFGVVREAKTEVRVGKYIIPKGATVQSGLYFIMNDTAYFEHPEKFNPYRFLDPETKKFIPNERVIPFGLGKRNCLGQALGEQEFFLFVGGILAKFEILQVPGSELPSYDIQSSFPIGMVRSAPKFDVILKPRIEF